MFVCVSSSQVEFIASHLVTLLVLSTPVRILRALPCPCNPDVGGFPVDRMLRCEICEPVFDFRGGLIKS